LVVTFRLKLRRKLHLLDVRLEGDDTKAQGSLGADKIAMEPGGHAAWELEHRDGFARYVLGIED
jgi:hypothetical protein